MKVGILGGGLAGVSLAYFLQEKGHLVEVLEKETECGGLCRSFEKNGFCFDLGGHIIFSKDKTILDLMVKMLGQNKKKHYRNNKVWFKKRFVKYPFENGLSVLDKEDIFDCLHGFIFNSHPKPKNFKQWIEYTFGDGLAKHYLLPYNEKIWKCKAENMGLEWVARVPKPPVEDIIKSALGIETEGYTHQLYFYYPLQGGIQFLIKSFESKLDQVTRNYEVKSVRKEKGEWIVSNGKDEKKYDQIVSCLPIFDLASAIPNLPQKVERSIKRLQYNSLAIVMIGINQPAKNDRFAVYLSQKDVLFHRICFHSYMGPWYAPLGKSLIVAEITFKKGDSISRMKDQALVKEVVDGLAQEGFIKKSHVSATAVQRMPYGYVVHDLEYKKNTQAFKEYFKKINLPLCGRFAEFEYLNMDETIRHAMNLSEKI